MNMREITLTSEARRLAEDPAIQNLTAQIIEETDDFSESVASSAADFDFDKEALLEEFLLSDSFQGLSDTEKCHATRAVNIALQDQQPASWGIEGEPSMDNLLNLPALIARVPVTHGDSVITTGAVLLDIDRVAPGFDHREFVESRVEFANFIGALIVAESESSDTQQNSFRYASGPFTDQQVAVGGDFHGDFRLSQHEIYPHGSIDPAGVPVPYAPIGNQRAVAAYHSVEANILVDTLKHLHVSGFSDAEQKEVVESAIAAFMGSLPEDDDSPFGARFADYGTQDSDFWHDEINMFFTDAEYRQKTLDRGVWSQSAISPNGERKLLTKTVDGELVFINTYKEDDEVKEAAKSAVRIPTEQVGPFVTALLHQANYGMGRTSPKGLLSLLETRLSTSVA